MLSLVLGHDGIMPFGRYCELVLRPSCLCWGGVIESGDLFVYAMRDCGCGRWVSCLIWRGLMTLRGEAVAAEVVSMGRLNWTLGLGKTRGKIGVDVVNRRGSFVGVHGGGTSPESCEAGLHGPRGRDGCVAAAYAVW